MRSWIVKLDKALQRNSPTALVREVAYRFARESRRREFYRQIHCSKIQISYRPLRYYRPELSNYPPWARAAIIAFADRILEGNYSLLGYGNLYLGTTPDWNLDFVSGYRWVLEESKLLTVVRHDGSDVKIPWELSRLQFLPVLAKAYCLTGKEEYRAAIRNLLDNWIEENPCGKGVNWTIAMEVALRAISICLTLDLMWPLRDIEQKWLDKVTAALWQHLLFIESHSEFSHLIRSNHYLSNIVGLTTLSASLQGPGMDTRFRRYARAVQREILLQTYDDGGDREASTGYHVLVSQMFLHSYLVQKARGMPIDPRFEQRLASMFAWIATLADAQGTVPQIGDCDDGRVELLQDDIGQFGLPVEQRNSLRLANYLGLGSYFFGPLFGGDGSDAAWFGAQTPYVPAREYRRLKMLHDSGLAVARLGAAQVIFSAMPNGINGRGSHTHCDKLSFVLRLDDIEVFCDSGTCCYTRDAQLRNQYRSTEAHNVVSIDGLEQNTISDDKGKLFCCGNEATIGPVICRDEEEAIILSASHAGYARLGVGCARTLRLKPDELVIEDHISGSGKHRIDVFFQLGPEWNVSEETNNGQHVQCAIDGPRSLVLNCVAARSLQLNLDNSGISRTYGSSLPATRIRISTATQLPATLVTHIEWNRQ